MVRTLIAVFTALFLAQLSFGQGAVRGKVSDPTGETIIGASVKVKELPTVFATTDLDGNYSLKLPDANPVTLIVSFVTLKTQERQVQVHNGEVAIVNFEMREDNELKEVVVERKARSTSDARLERMKINSAASIDYISGEAMLKTGDGDAAAAVKRVTGVSTVGAFVSVRGLADRYIVTTINGSRIPTLDPLTNNLRLDLFPTGLLDNIVITKTATPELPGDWAGALVSLNTSDYPEKLRVNVSSTFGYNPNSSFQDVVSSKRSSTDWQGHDDGMRNIPDGVPYESENFPHFIDPNLYQQLTLLGLGPTLNAYGIVSSTPGFGSTNMSASGSQLTHLALTELHLLAPALVNDPNAIQGAVDTYNSTYNLAYFSPIVNAELADLNKRFDNSNWRVKKVQGSPNFNQQVSIGNQLELFKKAKTPKTLGYLVGFRYIAETEFDGASTFERSGQDQSDENPGFTFDKKGTQQVCSQSNGWNALGSLSLKMDRNNTFSVMVMPNVLGVNNSRITAYKKPSVNGETFGSEDQFYEERKLWVYQYGSKHFIPAIRMRVEADASYSDGSRNVLDLKTVQYVLPAAGQTDTTMEQALDPAARIYRFLDETLFDSRISFELPLSSDERKTSKLKFGGGYRNDTRENRQSYFTILGAPSPAQWEQPGRFDLRPDGQFTSLYNPFGTFKDNDIGISRILSGFVMSDYTISPRLRVVGGLRAEHTDMITDILRFHEEGLAPDDPTRGTVGDVTIGGGGTPEPKPAVPGMLDQWDLLPSINFIYKLKDDEFTPMNLRLNYFRSLGRPSFREFSVVQQYDYILQGPVYGNPDLKLTTVDNFDIRLERFFKNKDNVSLSGFYKEFQNHIELLSTVAGGYTWRNANRSRVYGLELEGRIGITRKLEWRGNVTVMDSRSEFTSNSTGQAVNHQTAMFGQAPYIVNVMLNYALDSARFSASVSYNVQGPRLTVTNSELAPNTVSAYEMPRHLIDVTLNKYLGKHWGVKLRVRNLLNASQVRSYKFTSGYDVDFDRYTFGTEYQFTLSYTIK
jgi:hypothetical protein